MRSASRVLAVLSALALLGVGLSSCAAQTNHNHPYCGYGGDCTCADDGSITCTCDNQNGNGCCPTGLNTTPGCYVNCPCVPTDPECCDPGVWGYLCQCAGPITSATGSLWYYLLAITYIPPGNLSSATYLHGTSIGSQVQIQNTTSEGVMVQISGPTIQASAGYQYGTISGEAFQVTSNGSLGSASYFQQGCR